MAWCVVAEIQGQVDEPLAVRWFDFNEGFYYGLDVIGSTRKWRFNFLGSIFPGDTHGRTYASLIKGQVALTDIARDIIGISSEHAESSAQASKSPGRAVNHCLAAAMQGSLARGLGWRLRQAYGTRDHGLLDPYRSADLLYLNFDRPEPSELQKLWWLFTIQGVAAV